jgi:hypothetical protein
MNRISKQHFVSVNNPLWTIWLVILVLIAVPATGDLLVVQVPVSAGDDTGPGCPDGCRIVQVTEDGSEIELASGFVSVCDPTVSFDGKQIMFAGKHRRGDRWQIWRIDNQNGQPIQVTRGEGDHWAPLWVGSLFHLNDIKPTPRIAYLSAVPDQIDVRTGALVTALFSADLDGGRPWQITHNLHSDEEPAVMANGRIIYSSWRQAGTDSGRFVQLAVNIDGTDLMAYSGPSSGHQRMSAPGNDGRVYSILTTAPGWLDGGDLVYVRERRPLHSETILCRAEGGSYHSPCPTSDGGLIASFRPDDGERRYTLYRIDPASGQRLAMLYEKPGYHCIDTQELSPHPRVKGRSSVVNMEQETGVFFCLSTHISDHSEIQGLARAGRFKRVRVIEGLPAHRLQATPVTSQQVLGEVDLASDGSFHIEVPAQVPLRFELLNDSGEVSAQQHTWTWVMPREWRGCIGCHEDREMVAPNRLAEATVKPAVKLLRPIDDSQAGRRP